jgi:hypothetical protein
LRPALLEQQFKLRARLRSPLGDRKHCKRSLNAFITSAIGVLGEGIHELSPLLHGCTRQLGSSHDQSSIIQYLISLISSTEGTSSAPLPDGVTLA